MSPYHGGAHDGVRGADRHGRVGDDQQEQRGGEQRGHHAHLHQGPSQWIVLATSEIERDASACVRRQQAFALAPVCSPLHRLSCYSGAGHVCQVTGSQLTQKPRWGSKRGVDMEGPHHVQGHFTVAVSAGVALRVVRLRSALDGLGHAVTQVVAAQVEIESRT